MAEDINKRHPAMNFPTSSLSIDEEDDEVFNDYDDVDTKYNKKLKKEIAKKQKELAKEEKRLAKEQGRSNNIPEKQEEEKPNPFMNTARNNNAPQQQVKPQTPNPQSATQTNQNQPQEVKQQRQFSNQTASQQPRSAQQINNQANVTNQNTNNQNHTPNNFNQQTTRNNAANSYQQNANPNVQAGMNNNMRPNQYTQNQNGYSPQAQNNYQQTDPRMNYYNQGAYANNQNGYNSQMPNNYQQMDPRMNAYNQGIYANNQAGYVRQGYYEPKENPANSVQAHNNDQNQSSGVIENPANNIPSQNSGQRVGSTPNMQGSTPTAFNQFNGQTFGSTPNAPKETSTNNVPPRQDINQAFNNATIDNGEMNRSSSRLSEKREDPNKKADEKKDNIEELKQEVKANKNNNQIIKSAKLKIEHFYGRKIPSSILFFILSVGLGFLFLFFMERTTINSLLQNLDLLKDINFLPLTIIPIVLSSIAFAFNKRSGLINLGIPSVIIMGSAGSFLSALVFKLPFYLNIIIGLAFAILFSLIPAVLKVVFKVSEMISSLVLNFVSFGLVNYFYYLFADKLAGGIINQSTAIPYVIVKEINTANDLLINMGINYGTILLVFAIIYVLICKSKLGYKMKLLKINKNVFENNNNKSGGLIILSFVFSGLFAGASGVITSLNIGQVYNNILPFDNVFLKESLLGMAAANLAGNCIIGIFIYSSAYAYMYGLFNVLYLLGAINVFNFEFFNYLMIFITCFNEPFTNYLIKRKPPKLVVSKQVQAKPKKEKKKEEKQSEYDEQEDMPLGGELHAEA